MSRFVLQHSHEPGECAAAYAAWKGFDSPLRAEPALAACARGGHAVWWTVEAPDPGAALAQLPRFVAERTEAVEVSLLPLP